MKTEISKIDFYIENRNFKITINNIMNFKFRTKSKWVRFCKNVAFFTIRVQACGQKRLPVINNLKAGLGQADCLFLHQGIEIS